MRFCLGLCFSLFSPAIHVLSLLKTALARTSNNHSRDKILNSFIKILRLKIPSSVDIYIYVGIKTAAGRVGYDKSYNLHVNRKRAIMTDGGVKTRPQCRLPPSIHREDPCYTHMGAIFW